MSRSCGASCLRTRRSARQRSRRSQPRQCGLETLANPSCPAMMPPSAINECNFSATAGRGLLCIIPRKARRRAISPALGVRIAGSPHLQRGASSCECSKARRRRRRFHGVSSIACAATAVGNITSLNIAKHSLTLDRVSAALSFFHIASAHERCGVLRKSRDRVPST